MNTGCIVIGGGYFGCSAAYHLCRAGVPTTLIEANEIASGASGANFGCVQVQDANMGASLALTLAGFARMKHMRGELGADIGFEPLDSLLVAENETQLAELQRLYAEKKAYGLDIRWLDARAVQAAEPNLAPGKILAATWFAQGRIWPFAYQYALIARAKERGLALREHTRVSRLLIEGGECRGVVLESGETLRAEQIVVTAGYGTRALCATAGLALPVFDIKSECFVTEPLTPFLRHYYSSAGFFAEAHDPQKVSASLCIHQSAHGNLLIAETTKPASLYAPERLDLVSREHCARVPKLALSYFPALSGATLLRSWVARSPFTPDCEPCFGKSRVPGLIVAAGFKSASVVSPMVGQIVSELVARGESSFDLAAFSAGLR